MILKKSPTRRITSILAIFMAAVLIMQCTAEEQGEEQETEDHQEHEAELAVAMGQLQTYTHKYALAVEAENHELASFYFHEVEESVESITSEVPTYEGFDIAKLMGQYLEPKIEPTEEALENKDWDEIRNRTIELVDSCNSCHAASDHGFVKITPGFEKNPYSQDFSVSE